MPRPRFNKLPPEKRERLLETAAKEFATHGYEHASLNRILEKAEISKGAAYYYFDDKADLFITVLDHFVPEVMPLDVLEPSTLTAGNFWARAGDFYRKTYLYGYERPWVFGVLRASAELYSANPDHPALSARMESVLSQGRELLRHGQALGVVRTDLPDDLLADLINAVDSAADDWFLRHWQTLPSSEIERLATQTTDLLRRILLPGV